MEPRCLPKRKDEMTVVGDLFGIVVETSGDRCVIHMYIEDDEWYIYKCSFNKFWLPDLKEVLNGTFGYLAEQAQVQHQKVG